MKKLLVLAAAVGGLLTFGLAGPADAAGQACYSATVVVNGEAVVEQAECHQLP